MSGHLHLAPAQSTTARVRLPERPIRVVLADDHALMRRSLRLVLDNEDGVEVIAEASELTTVIRDVHGHLPCVLVLDRRMPEGSSIEMIRRLRERVPSTEIVVVTMDDNALFAQQALDAGAIGFVLKEFADTDLLPAVRNAARGEEYCSPRIAAQLESRS